LIPAKQKDKLQLDLSVTTKTESLYEAAFVLFNTTRIW